MEKVEDIKTKEAVIEFIKAYIYYRGGMGNRIDAFDIQDFLEGKRKREFKRIMKLWNENKIRKPKLRSKK